jgi:hypothetical protein
MKLFSIVAVVAACWFNSSAPAQSLFPRISAPIHPDDIKSFAVDAWLSDEQSAAIGELHLEYERRHTAEAGPLHEIAAEDRREATLIYSQPGRVSPIADLMRDAAISSSNYESVASRIESSFFTSAAGLLTSDQQFLLRRWQLARRRYALRPSTVELPLGRVDPFVLLEELVEEDDSHPRSVIPAYYGEDRLRGSREWLAEREELYVAALAAAARSREAANRVRFRLMDISLEMREASEIGDQARIAALQDEVERLSGRYGASVAPASRALHDYVSFLLDEFDREIDPEVSSQLRHESMRQAYGVFYSNPESLVDVFDQLLRIERLSDELKQAVQEIGDRYARQQRELSRELCSLQFEFMYVAMRSARDWIVDRGELASSIYDRLIARRTHDAETRKMLVATLGSEVASALRFPAPDSGEINRVLALYMTPEQRREERAQARAARTEEIRARREARRDDPRRRTDGDG